jgi:hypothetical protein
MEHIAALNAAPRTKMLLVSCGHFRRQAVVDIAAVVGKLDIPQNTNPGNRRGTPCHRKNALVIPMSRGLNRPTRPSGTTGPPLRRSFPGGL